MSLVERLVPVTRWQQNFFDSIFKNFHYEMHEMEREMALMRQQMLQLLPRDDKDVIHTDVNVSHPVVEEKGVTKFKLDFNVGMFKPEEISVRVLGNNILQVHAKHQEQTDQGFSHTEYVRQYQMPQGVITDQLQSSLSNDGVLTIEAPAPALPPKERLVPIEYKPNLTAKK